MSALPNVLVPPIDLGVSAQALLAMLFPQGRPGSRDVTRTAPAPFELHEHVGAERAVAEKFISQCFAESFGSNIEAFMPRLFTVRQQGGAICGAFGVRSASRKLFLEQYLDTPIERAIAEHAGQVAERATIVEVGHFSGAFPGAVRAMIALLTERLHREGFDWVVFTGTAGLRNAFRRLGLSPIDVAAADAERLPADQRVAWGSYYEHSPRVLVGNIHDGYRRMCGLEDAA